MKLINIGFGNMVNADRVIGIVSPDSAPIKRLVQDAREKGALIDASYGRRTQAVLIMDSDPAGKYYRPLCPRRRKLKGSIEYER